MTATIQRPLRGSRISTFYPVKNLPSLSSLDSAFQLQEYISLLIRLDVHDVERIVSLPGSTSKDKDNDENGESSEKDGEKGKSEVTVDESCWIYEHLRRLAQDLSHPLITTLQQECTRASCPEMKAGEWLYLCVAHGNDGAMEQCCAIDYILHTVDSATALLNSPRTFPSRLSIPQTSHRHFASLARRLGRIFAHAYFHHREAFEQAEAESSLYARFLALTSKFDLVPAEFLVIPPNQYNHDSRDRSSSPDRGYPDDRRQQQLHENEEQSSAQGQKDEQRNQNAAVEDNLGPVGSASPNGWIGETPGSASRSRFGRNRTDTMVFADAEATALADELAAKARQGELEPDYEAETPQTARPGEKSQDDEEEEEEQQDLDSEAQFEISLSPDEEILENVDISSIPTIVDAEEVVPSEQEKVVESIPASTSQAPAAFGEFTPEAIAIAVASLSPPATISIMLQTPESDIPVETQAEDAKDENSPPLPSETASDAPVEAEPAVADVTDSKDAEVKEEPAPSANTEPAPETKADEDEISAVLPATEGDEPEPVTDTPSS
ncbi:Mob1/phocein [Agrocybe pediades]|nr:Mob1/phocein [Agrocybe pediades]